MIRVRKFCKLFTKKEPNSHRFMKPSSNGKTNELIEHSVIKCSMNKQDFKLQKIKLYVLRSTAAAT